MSDIHGRTFEPSNSWSTSYSGGVQAMFKDLQFMSDVTLNQNLSLTEQINGTSQISLKLVTPSISFFPHTTACADGLVGTFNSLPLNILTNSLFIEVPIMERRAAQDEKKWSISLIED